MKRLLAALLLLRRPLMALAKPFVMVGAIIAAVGGARRLLQKEADLRGQVALITGASRGLGLLLAHKFADEGCRLVICARDAEELQRAEAQLMRRGAGVLAFVCDVANQNAVQNMVEKINSELGGVDILVNNAGLMDVGALEAHSTASFEDAMDVMFWGTLYPTLAVLPQMRARRSGRIVNVTSIGGKASVPHLMPYSAAKFAAVGFSEGLRAELVGEGVTVTTIVPGLMRTGSYLNAYFRGQNEKEFSWFALGASLPFISMDAERAAEQIVQATRRGEAERTLSVPAVLLARLQGVAPGLTADIMGLARRALLPAPDGPTVFRERGWDVQQRLEPPAREIVTTLTAMGLDAARRLNQLSPADTVRERAPRPEIPTPSNGGF